MHDKLGRILYHTTESLATLPERDKTLDTLSFPFRRRLLSTQRVLLQAVLAAVKDFSKTGRDLVYLEEAHINAMKVMVHDDLDLQTRLTSATIIAAIGLVRWSEVKFVNDFISKRCLLQYVRHDCIEGNLCF